jgi:selenide, water dikinase
MNENIRLTSLSKGSGCGCKIAPAVLQQILVSTDELPAFERLIAGPTHHEDAAVLQWEGDDCLIATTDFFTPVVDDPYAFGKIAAANALSDVYAMGGEPVMALGILGWPVDRLPAVMAQQVLEGARMICRVAGIPLAGGHSIETTEPFFGLAVNGRVHRKNLKQNHTARAGDLLFLTKPIGVGMALAAAKRGLATDEEVLAVTHQMMELNKVGAALGTIASVNAMTDVTGFGLLGHALEMCSSDQVAIELNTAFIPQRKENVSYIQRAIYPDMTMKNYSAFAQHTSPLSMADLLVLCDPQTSGGLLVAVDPSGLEEYLEVIRDFGLQGIADQSFGTFIAPLDKKIKLRNH